MGRDGSPQSKVVTTHVEDHERDALNELLGDLKLLTRYKYLRALVLADLIERGYLVPVNGTVGDLWNGFRLKTEKAEE